MTFITGFGFAPGRRCELQVRGQGPTDLRTKPRLVVSAGSSPPGGGSRSIDYLGSVHDVQEVGGAQSRGTAAAGRREGGLDLGLAAGAFPRREDPRGAKQ